MATIIAYIGWISLLYLLKLTKFATSTRVLLTTPVNPVKENAMLALHCHIWDLSDSQTVTIYRDVGEGTEDLSYGDDILTSADDRFYLARRILSDGSVVYFLSIMDINQKDQGSYSCEVMARSSGGLTRIAMDSVDVKVHYFPTDMYPLCTAAPDVIYTGTRIALNCTSESGFPTVSLTWKRTKTNKESNAVQVNSNGISYTELVFDVTMADRDDMFLCQMKSTVFPDQLESCHIGPLNIIQNPLHPGSNPVQDNGVQNKDTDTRDLITVPNKMYTQPSGTKDKLQCQKLCSAKTASNLSVWRIATLIATALAFVLLIIGLTLYIKIHRETASRKKRQSQQPAPSRQPIDCLYEELKYRQDFEGNKVYMALVRPRKPDSLAVPVTNMTIVDPRDPEGNYTLTPTTFNVNTSMQQ